jgi:hypothetical protein
MQAGPIKWIMRNGGLPAASWGLLPLGGDGSVRPWIDLSPIFSKQKRCRSEFSAIYSKCVKDSSST